METSEKSVKSLSMMFLAAILNVTSIRYNICNDVDLRMEKINITEVRNNGMEFLRGSYVDEINVNSNQTSIVK